MIQSKLKLKFRVFLVELASLGPYWMTFRVCPGLSTQNVVNTN